MNGNFREQTQEASDDAVQSEPWPGQAWDRESGQGQTGLHRERPHFPTLQKPQKALLQEWNH